jgi:hypothetical protein
MLNEDKRPEVWVARRLSSRGLGCSIKTVAYFVSKARVQSATISYSRSGKECKKYEVEFETPQALEELNYVGNVFVQVGDHVEVDKVDKSYRVIKQYVEELNKKLLEVKLENAISTTYSKDVKEQHDEDVLFGENLENYFNNTYCNIINN